MTAWAKIQQTTDGKFQLRLRTGGVSSVLATFDTFDEANATVLKYIGPVHMDHMPDPRTGLDGWFGEAL